MTDDSSDDNSDKHESLGHGHHDSEEVHQEEGEPWLVSYADLMTLLFGFFVLMYTFAAQDEKRMECLNTKLLEAFGEESESEDVQEKIATANVALKALQMMVTMVNLDSLDEMLDKLEKKSGSGSAAKSLEKLKGELKETSKFDALQALVDSDMQRRTVTVVIPDTVLFESGTEVLSASARARLKTIAETVRAVSAIASIEVIGHSDGVQSKAGADNWGLSASRAAVVGRFLIASGLNERLFKVSGKGSMSPLFPEVDKNGQPNLDNRRRNRRVEIVVQQDRS